MKKVLLVCVCFWCMASAAIAQDRATHEIHAAMLYNFIKYIQWPNENEGGDFVVGIYGDDNLFNTFKQLYDGKPKGNKKYVVRKLVAVSEAANCHVFYLSKTKSKEFEDLKAIITGKPILSVTDGNNLGSKGSCINFKVVDGKLRFELNQNSLMSSNLKVSTQLSSMAILI